MRSIAPCCGLTAASLLMAGLLALPAGAAESDWMNAGEARIRLVAAGAAGSAPIRAGIEVQMTRGWYTYWRYPGDAGIPPQFDWYGSTNVSGIAVRFPAPKRIAVGGGLHSIGYYDAVILPVEVRPTDPSRPVTLRLRLELGVCEKICIPAEARLELAIPPGMISAIPALEKAEARVPRIVPIGERPELAVVGVRLDRGKEPRALVDVAVPHGGDFDLFAEGPTNEWSLPLPILFKTAGTRARFVVPIDGAPPRADPIPSKVRLTLVAGGVGIEVNAPLD